MKAHARHGTCTRRTVDMLGATFMAKYGKMGGEKVTEALLERKRGEFLRGALGGRDSAAKEESQALSGP